MLNVEIEQWRALLLTLLDGCSPVTPSEIATLAEMVKWAELLESPLSRYQAGAHFTASAIVCDKLGSRTCLVHHRKFDRWLQPGGHFEECDQGDVRVAAMREATEETACVVELAALAPIPMDIDIHKIPAMGAEPSHLHLDLRLLVVARAPQQLAYAPDEALGARWFTWDEGLRVAGDASVRRALQRARDFFCGH